MALVVQLLTFGSVTATQIAPAGTYVKKILIAPARGNAANMFVGKSTLHQDGSVGLIADLAQPPTGGATDVLQRFEINAQGSDHNYDASDVWVWGTTGDVANVTYWTI